jgi:hypothetical protein
MMNKPAFSFQDGALLIAGPQLHLRFRWLPIPLAECQVPGQKSWAPCWPSLRLLRPPQAAAQEGGATEPSAQAQAKAEAFAAFRNATPPEWVALVDAFESHQWPLLRLLQAVPAAGDLARANPVLAYALANNLEFRGTSPEAAAEQAVWYSHRKQKVILEWLGFPASESLARLFRKIPPPSVYPSLLRRVRGTLKHWPELQPLLAHLPAISRPVLELASHSELARLTTPKLLHEVAQRTAEPVADQVAEVIQTGVTLRHELGLALPLRPFQSMAQVLRFQEEVDAEYRAFLIRREEARVEVARRQRLAEEACERERRETAARRRRGPELRRQPFPPPPLPGTATIRPLDSDKALEREAREMLHCVSRYGPIVRQGDVYCYKVLAPERATLCITRRADGCWRRTELKGASNEEPALATINAVEAWLESHRVSV